MRIRERNDRMSWDAQRIGFLSTKDGLPSLQTVDANVSTLQAAISAYQSTPTPERYQDINKQLTALQAIQKQYASLSSAITSQLQQDSSSLPLPPLLTENGTLQTTITHLEKVHKELKVDAESAMAREELLRSRNTAVTRHQLFLLDRPIRQGVLPYLWVVSVLFIGAGLILFKMMFPVLPDVSFLDTLLSFFYDRTVLIALLVCALITILFLALKVGGVFGK